MSRLIEFDLSDGASIVVETDDSLEATVRGTALTAIAEKSTKSFHDALAVMRPVAEAALSRLAGLAQKPESVEIEFGLKFTANAGAIIAATGAEAALKIKLIWKRDKG